MSSSQLSLKIKDLQAKNWYYGPISRTDAVTLLHHDGEFLVRDCISSPGAYVLTCRHAEKILHFRINQIVERDVEEKVAHYYYQFEDDCFPSVDELISHYLITGKPVSMASGAIILKPKDRQNAPGFYPDQMYAPLQKNGFPTHVRSHSSMSSGPPPGSPTPSHVTHRSDGLVMLKSGSRASLLTNGADDSCSSTQGSCAPAELKRYKSLPGDKLVKRRRVKRRAPSPPKDKPRYRPPSSASTATTSNPTTNRKMQQTLDLPKEADSVVSTGGTVSGVRLRRKKFQILNRNKPMNLMQRQTVYFGAKLDDKIWQLGTLRDDERRFSLPRISSSSDEEIEPWKPRRDIGQHGLVRSPSDSSLMYLNQLGLKAKTDKLVRSAKKSNDIEIVVIQNIDLPEDLKLPVKKKIFRRQMAPLSNGNCSDSPYQESIYDCVPKPRSCLREDQLKYSELYDVPRKLLAPQEIRAAEKDKNIQNFSPSSPSSRLFPYDGGAPWLSGNGRSVSVLCTRQTTSEDQHFGQNRRPTHLVMSSASLNCPTAFEEPNNQSDTNASLNRHSNYSDLHNLSDESPVVPPRRKNQQPPPKLPPKKGKSNGTKLSADQNTGSDDDMSNVDTVSYSDQPSSPCRSDCCTSCEKKNQNRFESLSNFEVENFSDDDGDGDGDSLSLLELQRDLTPFQLLDGNVAPSNGVSWQPHPTQASDTMSTLSSVSSITLQGGDDMSYTTYDDTTSLPDDPFPQGLPSLCHSSTEDISSSSTLESDPHSPEKSCHVIEEIVDDNDLHVTSPSPPLPPPPESPHSEEDGDQQASMHVVFDQQNCSEIETFVSSHESRSSHSSQLTTTPTDQQMLQENCQSVTTNGHSSFSSYSCNLLPSPNDVEKSATNGHDDHDEHDDHLVQALPKARSADPLSGGRCYCFITSHYVTGSDISPSSYARSLDRLSTKTTETESRTSPSPPSDCTPPPSSNGFDYFDMDPFISNIDPANFQTLFLPGTGNKPLDPLAVRAIHRTLVEMSSESLAAHLTRTDLEFFGLDDVNTDCEIEPCFFAENGSSQKSKFINLSSTSKIGRQFRQDALDRCLCLRTLVIVTILTAPNLTDSAKMLSRWIQIADHVLNQFCNKFAFFNIVSACGLNKHLRRWRDLWETLHDVHFNEANKFENILLPQLTFLARDSMETTALPLILPYILKNHPQQIKKSFLSDLRSEVSAIENIDESSWCLIGDLEATFRRNGSAYLSELEGGAAIFEPLLLDLFRTEFHIKLLWGSGVGVQEFPQNFSQRHSKFSKVIAALAAICTK